MVHASAEKLEHTGPAERAASAPQSQQLGKSEQPWLKEKEESHQSGVESSMMKEGGFQRGARKQAENFPRKHEPISGPISSPETCRESCFHPKSGKMRNRKEDWEIKSLLVAGQNESG